MIMICHPHPLLTASGGNSVRVASRISAAGDTSGNFAQMRSLSTSHKAHTGQGSC